jgi:hypothetical protein
MDERRNDRRQKANARELKRERDCEKEYNGQFRLVFEILSSSNDINIKAFYHHLSFPFLESH